MKRYEKLEVSILTCVQDVITSSGYAVGEDNVNEVLNGWLAGGEQQ